MKFRELTDGQRIVRRQLFLMMEPLSPTKKMFKTEEECWTAGWVHINESTRIAYGKHIKYLGTPYLEVVNPDDIDDGKRVIREICPSDKCDQNILAKFSEPLTQDEIDSLKPFYRYTVLAHGTKNILNRTQFTRHELQSVINEFHARHGGGITWEDHDKFISQCNYHDCPSDIDEFEEWYRLRGKYAA